MFCRNCGKELSQSMKFCDKCGTQVLVAEVKVEPEKVRKNPLVKNKYILPATIITFIALFCAMFPWPKSWNIGTSLWMRILIVALGLLATVYVNKARKYNLELYKKYQEKDFESLLKFVSITSKVVVTVGTFALIMM